VAATDGRWSAFRRGFLATLSVPGLILLASAAGFGALARDSGLGIGNALVMMAAFYALPAQVVMVDQLARGGAIVGSALAVALIGIRLLPMTVVITPYLGGASEPLWKRLLAAHGVAITGWIEGMRRLPHLPESERMPLFLGLGGGFVLISVAGTAAGYVVAGTLPPLWAAALLFLTPLYFAIALLATAGGAAGLAAIVIGAMLGPIFFLLTPGLDLLLTGLTGGTLAHFGVRRWTRATSLGGSDGGP
jgi:predicted branched-subunit amino acid permease